MQLEFHSDGMMMAQLVKPRHSARQREHRQAAAALKATPMVLSECGEDRVAKGELCFRHIARDKIGIFSAEDRVVQFLAGQQQSCAPVHQETRRFRERQVPRMTMLITVPERLVSAAEPVMAGDKIVKEHTWPAPTQLREGNDVEFNVHSGNGAHRVSQGEQLLPKTTPVKNRMATKEHIEFKVVVGMVPISPRENSALAATVSASKQQRIQSLPRDYPLQTIQGAGANCGNVSFEPLVAVQRKSPRPSRRRWTEEARRLHSICFGGRH
jgi:hypothetical protein